MRRVDLVNSLFKKNMLSENEKAYLIKGITRIEYAKGESLLKQKIYSPYLFFLESGLVKLVIEGHKGRNLISEVLVSNEFLGYSTIFSEQYQKFSAIALKQTSVFCIEIKRVEEIADSNINLLKFILLRMKSKSEYFVNKLNVLGNKQIHGRFADALLYLHEPKFSGEQIFTYLSRKELSELAGISLDSAMKVINELKNDKIIELSKKNILIKDMEMLERLARIG